MCIGYVFVYEKESLILIHTRVYYVHIYEVWFSDERKLARVGLCASEGITVRAFTVGMVNVWIALSCMFTCSRRQ